MGRVLVLGAGFSKPLGGPLLAELLDPRFDASQGDARLILSQAKRAVEKRGITVEMLFTEAWNDSLPPVTVAQMWPWSRRDLLRALKRHLEIVAARPALPSPHSRLGHAYVDFLRGFSARKDAVISFNYDLVVEQSKLGIRYGFGDVELSGTPIDPGRAPLNLLKLHGSVNWGVCRACQGRQRPNVVIFREPYFENTQMACPWCDGGVLEAGIVPPLHGKDRMLRHMESMWRAARDALRQASEIVIVGYSLPPGDKEAFRLFSKHAGGAATTTAVLGPSGAPGQVRLAFPGLVDTKKYIQEVLLGPGWRQVMLRETAGPRPLIRPWELDSVRTNGIVSGNRAYVRGIERSHEEAQVREILAHKLRRQRRNPS